MKLPYFRLLFITALVCVLYTTLSSYSNTSTNTMANSSQTGCSCHGVASNNTIISVDGFPSPSDGYNLGQVYPVTITVSNAGKLACGINVSVTTGTISNLGTNLTAVSATAIRHSSPKAMVNGTTTFTFDWIAPTASSATLFLYASANAVNSNGNTIGDAYNTYNLNVPLNIDYLTFDAQTKPNQIRLFWKTTTENLLKYFVIQKSADGVIFDSLDKVIAVGGAGVGKDYSYLDFPPHSGEYFYRLKIVDGYQNEGFSKIQKVTFDNGASLEGFSFPNPSEYKQSININIFNNKSKNLLIKMSDIDGNIVYTENFSAIKGTNYLFIPNQFPSGMYQISIAPTVGKSIYFKHMIN
jgi:hypothetical protein